MEQVEPSSVSLCLDTANQCLWRGTERVALTPKAYGLLVYLAERPQRLVTKDELLDRLWTGTVVTDGVLKVCVRELRIALRDDARAPHWIQTHHRRGYAFLRQLPRRESGVLAVEPVAEVSVPFVGREAELVELTSAMQRALAGERGIVFVTGAPGIGKTALGEAFLRGVREREELLVGRGQCLESFGPGEAYLPVLDALGRLGRGPHRARIREWLARCAPTWLMQLPALCDVGERERLAREVLGATRERMLREMAEALETLTQESPLVLMLEDLHWSDPSTLDLVAVLARRRERARLLLVLTHRAVDVIEPNHPLKALEADLSSRRLSRRIVLDDLGHTAVERYLDQRFPGHALPRSAAHAIHERTQGHPLFFVHVVDWLVDQGLLCERDGRIELDGDLARLADEVPESIREVLELQVSRLAAPEQSVLEAAAVAGMEFPTAAVAAGLELDPVVVEEQCEALARRGQFLRRADVGRFPDGSLSARFAFTHGLCADTLYRRIAPGRRARLHQRIGLRGEVLYGARAGEIAAELALHFDEGRDHRRAIEYHLSAAANDARRYANREATAQLERALRIATLLPAAERADASLEVLEALGLVRRSMGDMSASAEAFEALVATARELGRREPQVRGLLYLASALFWVDRERCLAAVDRAVEASARVADGLLRAHALGYCGHWNLNLRGFDARHVRACEEAVAAARGAADPRMLVQHVVRLAYARLLASRYDEAVVACDEGFDLALAAGDAFEWLLATFFRAWTLLHAGRWAEMQLTLERGLAMAEKNGHRSWSMLYRLEQAQLASAAHDFERAFALTTGVLEEASSRTEPTGQILFHGRIARAEAQLGLGRREDAAATLVEIERELSGKEGLMDWMLYLPLRAIGAECRLALGDRAGALAQALDLTARADQSGERSYQALAAELLARTARAGKRPAETKRWIERLLQVTTKGDLPVVRLRALRTAAELGVDVPAGAQEAERVVARLAGELGGDTDLARSFRRHVGAKRR